MVETADPGLWLPSTQETAKKVAGACEISHMKLLSGGGAATVEIYDATSDSEANSNSKKWVLDAAQTSNDSDHFDPPLVFRKGVYAVCTQGQANNPVFCFAARKYTT